MRLIDADIILYFKGKDIVGEDAYITDRETIDAMPTVDAEPIRHGHWEKQDDLGSTEWQLCSICKRITKIDTVFDRVFEYCPHCGAKMDEVEE